jgi:Flp pilus assembly protein TadB
MFPRKLLPLKIILKFLNKPNIKLYKPQTYNYKPIYYYTDKEAREKRAKKKKKKENSETEEQVKKYDGALKRGSFREEFEKNNKIRKEYSRKSNTRLIIIMAVLAAIAYWILFW